LDNKSKKFVFSNRVVDNWNSLSAVLTAATLTHLRSIFQFNQSENPIIIVKKCDKVEVGDIGISLCLLKPSLSSTVAVSMNNASLSFQKFHQISDLNYHCPLTSTKLYYLVTEAHMYEQVA